MTHVTTNDGLFVSDAAKELGKSTTTLVNYLRKHLPQTLIKRKNSNNRLCNYITYDGMQGLRAHYTPTVVQERNPLVEENARLRAEVERLQARVKELEQQPRPTKTKKSKSKPTARDLLSPDERAARNS